MSASRVEYPSLSKLNSEAIACNLCPRLRRYCERIAKTKRRQFRDWEYWGKPLPGFGDPRAHLLILGLAPAAHGGNRTGRMFTGDGSAQFLMAALHKFKFANQSTSENVSDGLSSEGCLHDCNCKMCSSKEQAESQRDRYLPKILDARDSITRKCTSCTSPGHE